MLNDETLDREKLWDVLNLQEFDQEMATQKQSMELDSIAKSLAFEKNISTQKPFVDMELST